LSSYTQNVGSVEEPLVGIVSESETKKHKLRVLQVERGVPEEVSYRCDDLKSGRVVVSSSFSNTSSFIPPQNKSTSPYAFDGTRYLFLSRYLRRVPPIILLAYTSEQC